MNLREYLYGVRLPESPDTIGEGAKVLFGNYKALADAIAGIPAGPQGEKGDKGDTGEIGPQGPVGPAGTDGADGASDANYTHEQGVASREWVVTHNLGKYPTVTCYEDLGSAGMSEIEGVVEQISTSQLKVRFNGVVSGRAVCN